MFAEGKGRSRRDDKKAGIDKQYVYSENTYRTYMREAKHFIEWVRENHPEARHLDECLPYVDEWLQAMINEGKSPYTITTRKSAMAKLFKVDYAAFIGTPPRERAGITRSRAQVEYDRHISAEKEAYWGTITAACGLRISELKRARGTDLREGTVTLADGTRQPCYVVHVPRGKGGKSRDVLLWGETPEDTERIAAMFRDAGDERVFTTIPKAYDNHHYRAVYARRIYELYARPKKDLPVKERYIMRKDRAGEVLDRRAMRIVSRVLGHNRVDVVAEHYLY